MNILDILHYLIFQLYFYRLKEKHFKSNWNNVVVKMHIVIDITIYTIVKICGMIILFLITTQFTNIKVDNFITYDKCSKDKRMIVSNIGRLMWCNMILTGEYSNFFTADIYIMNTNYVCISTFT